MNSQAVHSILAEPMGPSEAAHEPGLLEVGLFAALLLIMCVLAAMTTRGYLTAVAANGDNGSYARVADAIRSHSLASAGTVKQFWGLSYCTAALCAAFRTTPYQAIGIISLFSTVASLVLVAQLWSGWIAIYFAATNFTLIQMGAFGGAEPLFLLLVLISLRFARQERWASCSLAGALSATVRPLGVILLASVCIHLRRKFKVLSLVLGIAAGVFLLYFAPFALFLGNPFLNWSGYQQQDWSGHAPISWPLAALIKNLSSGANLGNPAMVVLKIGYIGVHLAALIGLGASPGRRQRLFTHPIEGGVVVFYSVFLLTYNAPTWAASIYPRLLMPITPMLFDAYSDLLPRNRAWPAALGALSVVLAIAANFGFSGVRILLHL